MNETDRAAEQELLDYAPLSGPERYAAFVAAVAHTGRLWVAESGEFVLTLFDDDGQELLPVWPSTGTARAALAAAPKLKGYAPVLRELDAWRSQAAPALTEAGLGVGVFPNTTMQCAVVTPAELLGHVDAVIADDGEPLDEDGDGGLDLERAQRELAQKFAKPKG
jgi:hypothetical protein